MNSWVVTKNVFCEMCLFFSYTILNCHFEDLFWHCLILSVSNLWTYEYEDGNTWNHCCIYLFKNFKNQNMNKSVIFFIKGLPKTFWTGGKKLELLDLGGLTECYMPLPEAVLVEINANYLYWTIYRWIQCSTLFLIALQKPTRGINEMSIWFMKIDWVLGLLWASVQALIWLNCLFLPLIMSYHSDFRSLL